MPAAVTSDPSVDGNQIKIVLYRDEIATAPMHVSLSWEQFVEFLTLYVEESPCTVETCVGKKCPHKSHSSKPDNPMAWSPVDIEGKRLDVNVRHITLLTLDFDHVDEEAARIVIGKLTPWEHVLHTTHNNRDGEICFRAILRLSRQVHVNQWHRFLAAAVAFLGVSVTSKAGTEQPDKICKNRSRFYYRPSHPVGAPRDARHGQGKVLDVDEVLAWADAGAFATPIYSGGEQRPLHDEADWDIDSEAVTSAIDVMVRYFPPVQRHPLCLALGGMLRRAGASAEVARYIVREIAAQGGSDDPDGRADTVWHTYALDGETAAMTGFTRIAEIVGEDVAEEFGDFLTDARNESLLRGWEVLERATTAIATIPAAASTPAVPSVAVVDLAELRKEIVSIAARRARNRPTRQQIDAILLHHIVNGEPIARPAGVGDVETVS